MTPHPLPVEENHFIKMKSPGGGGAGFPVWLPVALLRISEALLGLRVREEERIHQRCVICLTPIQLCFSGFTG